MEFRIACCLVLVAVMSAAARKPNVLFILADDLGWSDTTLYGTTSLYQTPNIQRLAKSGMTFTRAYAASPLCSPTRASILTGQNPARVGITSPGCHTPQVSLKPTVQEKAAPHIKTLVCRSATRFDTRHYTLAEQLKDAGYATGHFGKWHLGPEPYSPLEHGFDVDVPHWPGPGPAGSFVAPWKFKNFKARTPNEHIEDRMGDEAVAWMEAHKEAPFFLNYWQFSVHAPFDAKAELIEKYRSLIDPDSPQRSPTYAAMVQSLDDNVGKMLDALERLDLVKNTIVIFFSDNGGNMYNEVDGTTPTSNVPLRGGKAVLYEGGIRVPCVVRWPGVVEPNTRSDALIQSVDFYPTLLEGLGLKSDQLFDGVSILPALKGEVLGRDAIYTYFPHATKVPDALPPAVSVHQGDWKLVRVFFDAPDRNHRYELYNLRDDEGEQHNLAAAHSERVKAMDALIEKFLVDTAAVRPKPNPAYDPGAKPMPTGVARIAGWRPGKDCTLKVVNKQLHITSTGNDPNLSFVFKKAFPKGAYTVRLRFASDAPGAGQLFWSEKGVSPLFRKERSTKFDIKPGKESQVVEVELRPGKTLTGLRLDPAQGKGQIRIQELTLVNAGGKVVHTGQFK